MNDILQVGKLYQHKRNKYFYVYIINLDDSRTKIDATLVTGIRIRDDYTPGLDNDIAEFPSVTMDNFQLVNDE